MYDYIRFCFEDDQRIIIEAAVCRDDEAIAVKCAGACTLDQVVVGNMSWPKKARFDRYLEYYRRSHRLAHGIVVDEENRIRDGYISYLIANLEGGKNCSPQIIRIDSNVRFRKTVHGRHVRKHNGKYVIKDPKEYIWLYNLKDPVVPGDILLADTRRGRDLMIVDRIDYAEGKLLYNKYRRIVKHIGNAGDIIPSAYVYRKEDAFSGSDPCVNIPARS